MASMQQLKDACKGEWLAIEITRREKGEPVEGNLISHSRERRDLWSTVRLEKGRTIYVTYAGPILDEGSAVAFDAI